MPKSPKRAARRGTPRSHPAPPVTLPPGSPPATLLKDLVRPLLRGEVPPRQWLHDFLTRWCGDLPGASKAIDDFLRSYDHSPTLQGWAVGEPAERELFVWVIATLAEEQMQITRAYVERALRRAGMLERVEVHAVNRIRRAFDRALAQEDMALGPPLRDAIAHELPPLVPVPRARGGRPRGLATRLLLALDFVLRHGGVRLEGSAMRHRILAALIREATGEPWTDERVRRELGRERNRAVRPASCAAHPVPAVYVATRPAAWLVRLNLLAPVGPHAGCRRWLVGAAAARFCVPLLATPRAVAATMRAKLVSFFEAQGFCVLPTRERSAG